MIGPDGGASASASSTQKSKDYKGLGAYLQHRYADRITLTFQQIEDLIGFPLPDAARSSAAWWDDAAGAPTPQSSSWRTALRTATVNLAARVVLFERA